MLHQLLLDLIQKAIGCLPRNLLIKWVEKRNNNEINHKQRNKNKNKNEENTVKRLASNNFLLKSNKSLWRAYGTNTELYSCSKQITHKSGINLSFLVPSNPLSALPFEPENEEKGTTNLYDTYRKKAKIPERKR